MSAAISGDFLLFHMLKGGVDKRTRDSMGASIAHTLRATSKNLAPLPPLSEADTQVVHRLRATGFADLGPLFSAEDVSRIQKYFSEKQLIFFNLTLEQPEAYGSKPADCPSSVRFGSWKQADISGCPTFMSLAHDPRLLGIAEAYLEAPATMTIITTWWSFPSDVAIGGMQHFHHDRDDFRCLKLFVYLTDVDMETGPHQFVEGTHDFGKLHNSVAQRQWPAADYVKFMQWMEVHRKEEKDVATLFPAESIRTIAGAMGSTFLEDTRGLHRGIPPRAGGRWAFEICYSLLPKFNGQYQAVARAAELQPNDRVAQATRLFYQ